MKISTIKIENFRSIKLLEFSIDDTTVFIGPNNAGKSAILEAVRIALNRKWGVRGTGFTEEDIHLNSTSADPRLEPSVRITFTFKEDQDVQWPVDMFSDLADIIIMNSDGHNMIKIAISYDWNNDKEAFEPSWEFLDDEGGTIRIRKRSINLSSFYNYILFFYLGALRDIKNEFSSNSRTWGGLLRSIKVPSELEDDIQNTLDELDSKLLESDPKFAEIAKIIGNSTEIAMDNSPGSAKLRMLPMNLWDLLTRAGIILRNEENRPWFPLAHHGQGIQSLSIIFLIQAAVAQQLAEELKPGVEPIFAIEEPEAHLHPQAVRTLWAKISQLPGQKLVSTHSPYFVQNVPLKDLRIVRFHNGSTQVSAAPQQIISDLPWTQEISDLITSKNWSQFYSDEESGRLTSNRIINDQMTTLISRVLIEHSDEDSVIERVQKFRHNARKLISVEDEKEFSFLGRRIRGEIFFARKWIIVEGVTEYLILRALGQVLDYDFDQYGVAVIDFQNNGNAGIYPALAEAFDIPWLMITDADQECTKFKKQLLKRGFNEEDFNNYFSTLDNENTIESQLIQDGNEEILREIMVETKGQKFTSCSLAELISGLKKSKTEYAYELSQKILGTHGLAAKMPKVFLDCIEKLRKSI